MALASYTMTLGWNPLPKPSETGRKPHHDLTYSRYTSFQWWKQDITNKEGSVAQFALGYESFGFQRVEGGIRYRDWVPAAKAVHLYGEFSMSTDDAYLFFQIIGASAVILAQETSMESGRLFSPITLTASLRFPTAQKLRFVPLGISTNFEVAITTEQGEQIVRLSPWSRYVTMDPGNPVMDGKSVA
jgi:hypothetical protein